MHWKLLALVGSGEGDATTWGAGGRLPICLFMLLNLNNVKVLAIEKIKFNSNSKENT